MGWQYFFIIFFTFSLKQTVLLGYCRAHIHSESMGCERQARAGRLGAPQHAFFSCGNEQSIVLHECLSAAVHRLAFAEADVHGVRTASLFTA
jgi:hypothetical protein